MSSFLRALLFLALFGAALGAGVATEKRKESKCTITDEFKAITCVMRTHEFMEKAAKLDLNDKPTVKEFNKACDGILPCIETLKCGSEEKEAIEATDNIVSYCEVVKFISEGFEECGTLLENKNSTCYNDYDPFPDHKKDGKKNANADQKEACKNFFGKDNCLKKEIMETCGQAKWEEFMKSMLALNKILNACDLSNV